MQEWQYLSVVFESDDSATAGEGNGNGQNAEEEGSLDYNNPDLFPYLIELRELGWELYVIQGKEFFLRRPKQA